MTLEGRVKKKVKAYLDKIGAYYFMPVQTGYGRRTLDFLVCFEGKFFAVETKAGDKGLDAKQIEIAKQIQKAGGLVYLVNEKNVDDFVKC